MKDESRYEGQFYNGKFHGTGIFRRADGTQFEGEFKEGKIWGCGLMTFADGSHGLPRNEGYFEGIMLVRREKCPEVLKKANESAEKALNLVNDF